MFLHSSLCSSQHVLGDKESFANFTPSFQRKSEAATLAMKMAMDHFMFEGTQSIVREMFIQELEEEVRLFREAMTYEYEDVSSDADLGRGSHLSLRSFLLCV